ncbi:hypothetical protein HMPREF9005_1177 [Actinomyces sp. oral taxon 178 str. F0338]|nr:hypothetical protein HMPREF9005_1177 [Actinomyces sp. oral taxon 178 str. F0338]
MRGKLTGVDWARTPRGLIPARAGKTSRPPVAGRRGSAHPRACGENEGAWKGKITGTGSSPRVRGKRGRRFGCA